MSDAPNQPSCGHSLTGLTESSECGRFGVSVVDVPVRGSFPEQVTRFTGKTRVIGLPLLSIASGSYGGEKVGRRVVLIALGDVVRPRLGDRRYPAATLAVLVHASRINYDRTNGADPNLSAR